MALTLLAPGCGAEVDDIGQAVAAVVDTSTPTGTWHLNANGARLTLAIATAGSSFSGTIRTEGATSGDPLSQFTWNPTGRWLEFRRDRRGAYEWYRVRLTEGVLAGRFSRRTQPGAPSRTQYTYHVTGWNEAYIDQSGLTPRVWDLTINTTFLARVRVDRDRLGALRGRMKIYARTTSGSSGEELEFDLSNLSWNGSQISFTRTGPGYVQVYTGTTNGRRISGTFTHNGGAPTAWSGARAEVLSFGLGSRFSDRTAWQERTRARLGTLTQGFGAQPAAPTVTVLQSDLAPFSGTPYVDRDDNYAAWAQGYLLSKIRFSYQPPNLFDPSATTPTRSFNAYLAVPTAPPPPGGYRVVLAFNGHGGSARAVMTPSDVYFWYGDSFARRGYVVLAVDISHRDYADDANNETHPAIISNGYTTTDWEQDGERVSDAARALDYLLTRPDINPGRVVVTGLSMGGEVAHLAALDTRVAASIPAGYTTDMNVMHYNGNHSCFEWTWGNITEFVDVSDFESLVAPRPQVVLTGRIDTIFSRRTPPFSGAKQIVRRSMGAYDDGAQGLDTLVHYFHYDGHRYHVGDVNPSLPMAERGVVIPTLQTPLADGDLTWQTDSAVQARSTSLYDLLDTYIP